MVGNMPQGGQGKQIVEIWTGGSAKKRQRSNMSVMPSKKIYKVQMILRISESRKIYAPVLRNNEGDHMVAAVS
jgi:hypothetical protein